MVTLAVAAILQKVTGMGFVLVATPFIVFMMGPVQGVLIVSINGLLVSVIMAVTSIKHISWRRIWKIVIAAAIV